MQIYHQYQIVYDINPFYPAPTKYDLIQSFTALYDFEMILVSYGSFTRSSGQSINRFYITLIASDFGSSNYSIVCTLRQYLTGLRFINYFQSVIYHLTIIHKIFKSSFLPCVLVLYDIPYKN